MSQLSVFFQGTIATGITQPVDVMKTRLMEAKPGQYKVQWVHIESKVSYRPRLFCSIVETCLLEGLQTVWSRVSCELVTFRRGHFLFVI